jgi:hypothetical protein
MNGRRYLDTVEKVASWLLQSATEKIDRSDRPTSPSQRSVKGNKTPENLARTTVSDFFNSITSPADSRKNLMED